MTVPCSSYGIACMNRTGVPDSFAGMWFRPHNWQFEWGSLKWCQALAQFVNGCYDVENVALDEFGHIELLGHHVNYEDESDFTDSVVQFAARSRPKEGWNQHVFGRCDVARLQLEYELPGLHRRGLQLPEAGDVADHHPDQPPSGPAAWSGSLAP